MVEPLVMSEKSGRIIFTISGVLTKDRFDSLKKNIKAGKKLIKNTSEKIGKKVNVLLDITKFDGTYDLEALEMMVEFAKHNAEFIEKTAVFGGSHKTVAIGKIIIALAGRQNFKFFATKAEADEWLG